MKQFMYNDAGVADGCV